MIIFPPSFSPTVGFSLSLSLSLFISSSPDTLPQSTLLEVCFSPLLSDLFNFGHIVNQLYKKREKKEKKIIRVEQTTDELDETPIPFARQ